MELHERIAMQRRVNNFTQAGMAKALNVARQTYLDIEKGKTEPRISTAVELSKIFRCNLHWLLTGEHVASNDVVTELRNKLDEMQLVINRL